MASYFTDHGPERGPWLYRDAVMDSAIGVLGAPDEDKPIGVALGAGFTEDKVKLWRLTVHGTRLPGLFVIIDRQFWAAE